MKEKPHRNISEEEIEKLAASFSTFNQVTQKLRSAYQELEDRFGDLNRKMEETNQDLKESLAEKEKISRYLTNILESLTSGVLAIDLGGKVTLFNRKAEEILGHRAETVIGKPYREVIGKGADEKLTLPFVLKCYKQSRSESESCTKGEKEIQSQTGKNIPVSFSTSLLKDHEGEILGAVEIFFDLTRSKQMEEEMLRMKTLATLGEMAAVVAHEVKNPLGGIRGFADLLDRDLADGDPRKRLVKKIIEGVEALDRIVLGLLDHTKPIRLNPKITNLVNFIEEAINFFEMDATRNKSNIRIKKSYSQNDLYCQVDPEQFRQVLLNLLHNSVQAMPHGGEIRIELNREADVLDSNKTEVKMLKLRILLRVEQNVNKKKKKISHF